MASDQLDEDLIPKEPLPPFRPKVIWICLISACAGTLLVWQEIPAGNMLLFPTLGLMSGYSIKTRYRDGKNIVLRNLALLIGLFGFAYMIYSVTANDGDPIGWEGPVSFAAILLAYFLFSGKDGNFR